MDTVKTTPTEIMARLKGLPEHLQAHNRRFYVEAVSDDTRAPMVEYYRQVDEAAKAAFEWAKAQGASGFYAPRDGGHPYAFSFKADNDPSGPAWINAGRNYVAERGHVAKALSKRPAGKKLAEEVAALPSFPRRNVALAHLSAITDLRTDKGSSGVGFSDGKIHFPAPFSFAGRFFINAVNHNYDIAQAVEQAIQYAGTEDEKWAPSLDYKGDPISWRPGQGWVFLTKTEIDFLIAEENVRRAAHRAAATQEAGRG